ncbi:MAG TPA: HAD family hydrolase [Eggerthellaceae bacterium]|nr:HAD family hydrolase [Eggerthellaceae bacterium]
MAKAVFFDVGHTLLFADPPVPDVFTRVARRRGYDITVRDVEPCMADVNAYYQEEYLRDGDFWCIHERAVQIWLDMYTIMADYCGIAQGVPELAQAVYDEYLDARNWSAYPDVEACLKGLKRRGFQLGIISNWDATLEGLVRDLVLLPYFDDVVASATVGYRKPDHVIFEIALERMGVRADEAVHVGDLAEADGEGATSAGIHPIIIDRAGVVDDDRFQKISVLTDLVSLL